MKAEKSPCVSVLIPTLNEEDNIKRAINSVKSQTLSDLEILVCDGGSTDKTVNVVESHNYSDLQCFMNTDGLMPQYNTLCNAADGEYLSILDADSVMLPERLEKQVRIMEGNSDVGAVGTGLQFEDREGNVIKELNAPTGDGIKWESLRTNPVHHTTVLFRAKAVKTVGGYRDQPFGDYDLMIRLARKWELTNINEPLTRTVERQSRGGRNFSSIHNLYYNTLIGISALLAMNWTAAELPIAIAKRLATSAHLAYNLFTGN
jgi:glycosyltransferase involved in cell wall biosynthesis